MQKIIAMIPARLGSKRVMNKNLRLLSGKPLVYYAVCAAQQAKIFSDIYINSEAEIFANMADEYRVKFYKRPIDLASDTATNDMFVLDFIDKHECDIIVQINPTSPLISGKEVKGFVEAMLAGKYDTMHTVKSEQIEGLFKGKPLNFDPLGKMPRSQDLEPVMLFSSGIMAWETSNYRANMEKYSAATYGGSGKIGYFVLNGFAAIDIDHEEDFQIAELAMNCMKNSDRLKPQYYVPKGKMPRVETDVGEILKKDGVAFNELASDNQQIVNIKDIIARRAKNTSWSKRVINTENNSATLICQLPGEGTRRHYHNDWNEWWYIVAGEWKFEIDDEVIIVRDGDIVFIPKNCRHKITARGKNPAIRLAVSKDKMPHIYKE